MDFDPGRYDDGKGTDLDLLGSENPPSAIYERGGTPEGYVWDHVQPGPGPDFSELRANVKYPNPGLHTNRPAHGQEGYEDPITNLFEDLF